MCTGDYWEKMGGRRGRKEKGEKLYASVPESPRRKTKQFYSLI